MTEHRQPEAVRPGERNLPRPQVRQAIDDAAPAPGDLICGACGAGNRPTRNFCRRCAASLADAETVPPQPWWRRRALFRTAPLAGERPRRRWRIPRNRWFLPLAVLVTLACAGYLLRGPVESGFENVRDKLVKPREIHPLAGSEHASSAAPDHPAGLAFDGTTDQYWAPGSPGDGAGEFLEVGFTHPFRLVEIHVFPGVSTNEQAFLAQRRPSELQVAAVSADGRTTRKTLRLSDVPGEQVFQMHVSDVKRLRLTVVNSLGPKDRQVAIAEVAVFERP